MGATTGKVIRTAEAKAQRLGLCAKYEDILLITYYFGFGYMNADQLIRYLQYFYPTKKRPKIWEEIGILKNHGIVEVIPKVNNQSLIVLKKSAVMYLKQAEKSDNLPSIVAPAQSTYFASIMRNEAILGHLKRIKTDMTINQAISYLDLNTTLIHKARQNYRFIQNKSLNSPFAKIELDTLKQIHAKTLENLKGSSGEKANKSKDFTLNSMANQNIYIARFDKNNLEIIFLDTKNSFSAKKLEYLINNTTDYLKQLFQITDFEGLNVRYIFYATSPNRKAQIINNIKSFKGKSRSHMQSIKYNIFDVTDTTIALKNMVLSY